MTEHSWRQGADTIRTAYLNGEGARGDDGALAALLIDLSTQVPGGLTGLLTTSPHVLEEGERLAELEDLALDELGSARRLADRLPPSVLADFEAAARIAAPATADSADLARAAAACHFAVEVLAQDSTPQGLRGTDILASGVRGGAPGAYALARNATLAAGTVAAVALALWGGPAGPRAVPLRPLGTGTSWLLAAEESGSQEVARPALSPAEQAYRDGLGLLSSGDLQGAAARFRVAATAGHPRAQNRLGVMLSRGQGLTRDPRAATLWVRRAAEQGLTVAMRNLAWQLSEGPVATRDRREAQGWLLRAGEAGDREASYRLAVLLAEGREAPSPESLEWLRRAADAGHTGAMVDLARWTPWSEAESLLARAVAGGDATAARELGIRYLEGRDVEADLTRAADLLEQASEGGDVEAQYRYGRLVEEGRGRPASARGAAGWYHRAASQGHLGAQERLGRLGFAAGAPAPELR